MSYFLFQYKPHRPNFPDQLSELEALTLQAHFNYLIHLRDQKKLFLAGPLEDATLGIAILHCENLTEAQAIAEADPMVKANYFSVQVKNWRLSIHQPFPA
ncbi:MAG: YciI family protein [Bacteroidia bacterium]